MKVLNPIPNLPKKRKEKKMTQKQLASKANLSRQMLSNIERGYSLPSLKIAYQIALSLGSTIEYIFFDDNVQKMSDTA